MNQKLKDRLDGALERQPIPIRALASRDVERLLRVASTIQELRGILRDWRQKPLLRARALWALRLLNDSSVRAVLPSLLLERPRDAVLTWELAKTAVAFGSRKATDIARKMMREPSSLSRRTEAYMLGMLGGHSSRLLLENALRHDREIVVRIEAADALGAHRSKRSVPTLIRALNDASPRVRYAAAHALGEIGDAAAIPALEARANDGSRAGGSSLNLLIPTIIRRIQQASRNRRQPFARPRGASRMDTTSPDAPSRYRNAALDSAITSA